MTGLGAHPLRKRYPPGYPLVSAELLDEFRAAERLWLQGFRRRMYLEACRAFQTENEARQSYGLRPLRTLLKRHFRKVEPVWVPQD